MRYFEIDMSNEKESGCYSMCIKAIHKQNILERKYYKREEKDIYE